jgi:polyhydroxybutyrate depolymerase
VRATAVVGVLLLVVAVAGCRRSSQDSGPGTGVTVPSVAAPGTTGGTASTGEDGTAAPGGSTVASSARPAVTPAGHTIDADLHTPDGQDRTYHLYVPASLPPGQPVPLLVGLHGGSGWGTQFEAQSGFDGIAEANGFLVVYPDGTKIPLSPESRVWNSGDCCGAAQDDRDHVDDVAFISALIDHLEATYPIDRARVFAAGHSNGAMMTYRLACQLADKIDAVGLQAGTIGIPSCQPSHPVSVLHIHGEADDNVPIDGGVGPHGISRTDFPSPTDAVHHYAALDGCPATSADSKAPTNPDITMHVWAPCADGTEVEFLTVAGAGHAWMGHPGSRLVGVITGPPYPNLDASAQIWAFLAAHPRTT